MKLLLTLSYDGTGFCGYQVQKGCRTVQAELNRAAKELFGVDCDIVGCSRTDSGVHANMFCATVAEHNRPYLDLHMETEKVAMALSSHLPNDIAVYQAREVDDAFHARYDVRSKEYIYRIFNRPVRSPFEENRSWHIPKPFTEDEIERMNDAAAAFIGKQDFSAFMAQGSNVTGTVRTVFQSVVEKEGDIITFRVAADGFLYNMVRIMAGTLVMAAKENIGWSEMRELIATHDRSRMGITAPPEGLYLNYVEY